MVGEGIETGRQFDVLHALGCDAAQGFLLGRPMPVGGGVAPTSITRAEHVGVPARADRAFTARG